MMTHSSSEGVLLVIDVATSLYYRRRGHVPGAWWAVRSRLAETSSKIGDPSTIVVTSEDGVLARLAASDVASMWPGAAVRVLRGGTKAWIEAGGEVERGFTAPTTTADDVWYKPYDHDDGVPEQHMQEYLTWEVGLVEQLARDPTVSFRVWPAARGGADSRGRVVDPIE